MINSLWISKTGMEAQQMQLDVISNNLANLSTTGFKRGKAVFEDLMYQNLRQVGASNTEGSVLPTGLHLGLGVRTVATTRLFSQGTFQETKNPLDVAIDGNGFFQVTQADGTIGYTRDGTFELNAAGTLVTSSGLEVLGPVTIPFGSTSITIGPNGVVEAIVPPNTNPTQVGNLVLANFINPAGLEPRGGNLYIETVASGAPITGAPPANGLGVLKQNFLENSNVSAVEELVTMIQTQRAYEMNSKAIQTSDQMLQKLGQL